MYRTDDGGKTWRAVTMLSTLVPFTRLPAIVFD
jgi:hypothetical protein